MTKHDPLRGLRLVVAFAATFTRAGARPEEGRLYDAARLCRDGPELARAVAAARDGLADLEALLEAARQTDEAFARVYAGPPATRPTMPAEVHAAWGALLHALNPERECPRCGEYDCDGGCAFPEREKGCAS